MYSDEKALARTLLKIAESHTRGMCLHAERIQQCTRLLVEGAAKKGHKQLQCETFREHIVRASLLHDIGKIALPCHIVKKRGTLTDDEFRIVQRHTVAGEQLLNASWVKIHSPHSASLFIHIASCIARSHHERWDGTGYPDRLIGTAIPIGARIVAIADVYDALRTTRTYKRAWSHQEAVQYITSEAGRHFDPYLVDVFLAISPLLDLVWTHVEQNYSLNV